MTFKQVTHTQAEKQAMVDYSVAHSCDKAIAHFKIGSLRLVMYRRELGVIPSVDYVPEPKQVGMNPALMVMGKINGFFWCEV